MSRPWLSVVIPSYSQPECLARCLSHLVHWAPTGTEIIVVDDGSAQGQISAVAARWPKVVCLRHAFAQGFCAAANAGIRISRGEVVELLNDDAYVTAGWATAAVGALLADPARLAVAPLVLQAPNPLMDSPMASPLQPELVLQAQVDSAGDQYYGIGFARKRGHGRRLAELPAEFLEPGRVDAVSAAAGFYRGDWLRKQGGFDPTFRAYFEDVELSLRIAADGGHCWYEPRSIVWHEVSRSYGRKPRRDTLEQQSRNEERLFWKGLHALPTTHSWRRGLHLAGHAALLVAKAGRRMQEQSLAPWLSGRLRGIADAIKSSKFSV